MQIAAWDANGNVVFGYPEKTSEFCEKVNVTYADRKYCNRSDQLAALKCNEILQPHSYVCHAGVSEIVIPFLYEKKCMLFICLGQCVCFETEEEQRKVMLRYCKNKNIDSSYMNALFDKLPRFSKSHLDAIINVVSLALLQMHKNNSIEIRRDDILLKIDEYIADRLSDKITIKSICNEFHISKTSLYQLFEEYYHLTVKEYIIQKRLDVAKKLLTNTELSITEISEKIGKNYNDFIQSFKKYELISPSQYRNRYKIR